MSVLAIDTNGRTIALTNDGGYVARLNTDRLVQDTVRCLKRGNDPLWDGVSPFTARAATPAE